MNDKYYYSDGTTSSSLDLSKTLHREDGPAFEQADGYKAWYLNGEHHREDGPAIEYADGSKKWYVNGECHREDGPAIEDSDGDKHWYINDKRHREDGPAIEWTNGDGLWYLDGEFLHSLTKEHLIKYMEANNLTPAHLLTDSDKVVRTSAAKYKWDNA